MYVFDQGLLNMRSKSHMMIHFLLILNADLMNSLCNENLVLYQVVI
ncbi:hypothetical protein MNBD_GAMMA12-513 [hydrothermal vent metagenome]|uniref:Uncharacterized protein n=1 Tax=hydrothermal vent metagenome TaxID=652676 RepID=A0A3B0YVZ9_9ZZZZ